jgi:fibronectin type 3 domain-containing protein
MTTSSHINHHTKHTWRSLALVRESVLIFCVAILAGVAIYTSRSDNTAFGLLSQPVYADFIPVDIAFRDEVLLSQPFLELDVVDRDTSATQVEAQLFDSTNSPAVTDLTALNTRVGGEVMVYWAFPEGVAMANVYRSSVGSEETLLGARVAEPLFFDDQVENGEAYTYRVVSVVVDDTDTTKEFESSTSLEVVVTPVDLIAPHAPTDVRVATVDTDDGPALRIAWTNPPEKDTASLSIFRSTQFGTRGVFVGSVNVADDPVYTDATAPKNTDVYYTVVSYDEAGNSSSGDFQSPLPGNAFPFTPFGVETNEAN